MITYTYECRGCDATFEWEQKISESALSECPHCHSDLIKRLISGGSGFSLRGGGWSKSGYSSRVKEEIKNLPTVEDSDD